jgi:hypothetical protein
MSRVRLFDLAHARSGDKGDTVNVGVIARKLEDYDFLQSYNFLLHEALDGGGTVSLMTDAQGKTFSTALLRMWVDLPE